MKRNIEVEIVADSVNPNGKRITTALWTYPRFIHSEILTHRSLSRNAASSRAIPVKKVIAAIQENPAMPEWWGANQSGMQANGHLDDAEVRECKELWLKARDASVDYSRCLVEEGLHKQIANRVLEPWFHITTLVTATEWDNFFALRAHPAAQPEFQVLAYRMLDAMIKSHPQMKNWGEWHVPFDPGGENYNLSERLIVSVAKAARTSYVAFDANKTLDEQRALFDNMRTQGHWSPFEHQAMAADIMHSGNFREGWHQYRMDFQDQERSVSSYEELLATKPDWIEL